MTILVDPAVWPYRGRLFAHLVSDHDYEELHHFAHGIGLRRLSFQGDHYDIDAQRRQRAVAAGAHEVDARELVRRLREAGLRVRGKARSARWRLLHRSDDDGDPRRVAMVSRAVRDSLAQTMPPLLVDGAVRDAALATRRLAAHELPTGLVVLTRETEAVAVVGAEDPVPVGPRPDWDDVSFVSDEVWISPDGATVELFFRRC